MSDESDHDREFLRLFLASEPDLRAFIGAVVRDRHAREDVFQEVALALWRSFGTFDRNRKFGAWARGVAANKVLQERRRSGRLPLAVSEDVLESLAGGFERTEDGAARREEALRACLAAVPERPARLLGMRYAEGLSGAEMAVRERMSVDAVYQVLSRMRAQLEACVRRRLRSEGDGGEEVRG